MSYVAVCAPARGTTARHTGEGGPTACRRGARRRDAGHGAAGLGAADLTATGHAVRCSATRHAAGRAALTRTGSGSKRKVYRDIGIRRLADGNLGGGVLHIHAH